MMGSLVADDEHVTVWEPTTGKTVAGNAAPYRRNLSSWLSTHPGWEEKADELKSTKRRSAARRARVAAASFAALCAHEQVSTLLHQDLQNRMKNLGICVADALDDAYLNGEWSTDDYVRLEEGLVKLAHEIYLGGNDLGVLRDNRWQTVTATVGSDKAEDDVLTRAFSLLSRGMASAPASMKLITQCLEAAPGSLGDTWTPVSGSPGGEGDPARTLSLSGSNLSFLERSFRTPREPRITVWEPSTGRTISGNAAPCRRNLEQWMALHPGWVPKAEQNLSTSRKMRQSRSQDADYSPSQLTSSLLDQLQASEAAQYSSFDGNSSSLSDALQGLLNLKQGGLDTEPEDEGDPSAEYQSRQGESSTISNADSDGIMVDLDEGDAHNVMAMEE
eukprot:CAMPEP_0184684432 /NCGR_PEP_ID=MMETSP0312-20130426/15239_1 /TAXON_ID=31354 /ORGANISM="Compsopogon coeruleus, Strain SAG 36.94" /LENGTH=388 /DNA_ID=CAMNT_0027137595 /DNA_START=496 /DNA_END=1662 /DNA_ORIENTATION=-